LHEVLLFVRYLVERINHHFPKTSEPMSVEAPEWTQAAVRPVVRMIGMASSKRDDDIRISKFVRVLKKLNSHSPISDQFERDCPQLRGAWWTSQKQHMIRWFGEQNSRGSGAFTRAVPNVTALTTYNCLLCPAAFAWMAEALGEDPAVVKAAADAARGEPNARKRPGLLRRLLP
jgi:hypothetical protein